LGIAVLMALGMDAFGAVGYVLAAVSTGGFALQDAGLGALGRPSLEAAVIGIAVLGAISLPLYHAAWRRNWRRVANDPELRALLVALPVVTLLLLGAARLSGAHTAPLDLLLLGLSAQSTTGFSTLPVVHLDPASKWVLMGAMAIGGSAGSTAGGIKLFRFLLLVRLVQLLLRRLGMPRHAVSGLSLGGRRVEDETAMRALVLILLFVAAALGSWLPFLAGGYDPLDALFEVISALGTVGLSTGVTGSHLAPGLKAVLALDMLLGRVEFIAVLILLHPATWWGKRMGLSAKKEDLL
jgi:trk system potassium uptake protein TrkH